MEIGLRLFVFVISTLVLTLLALICVLTLLLEQSKTNDRIVEKINESAEVQVALKEDIKGLQDKLANQKKGSIVVAGVGIGLTVISLALEAYSFGRIAKLISVSAKHASSIDALFKRRGPV